MNRTNRSLYAEEIRAGWITLDRTIEDAKARVIAADQRAAQIIATHRAMHSRNQPQPRGFLRLFRSI